eukprot:GHVH01003603.1.p1 GENE.GHVH01003603.1~~GHVH01003603.1.p1  ORF type:complete len:279 (+),score=29.86 GHVH01003603.1:158-994(+)
MAPLYSEAAQEQHSPIGKIIQEFIEVENCFMKRNEASDRRVIQRFNEARGVRALNASQITCDNGTRICGIISESVSDDDSVTSSSNFHQSYQLEYDSGGPGLRPLKTQDKKKDSVIVSAVPNIEYRKKIVQQLLDNGMLSSRDYNTIVRRKRSKTKESQGVSRRAAGVPATGSRWSNDDESEYKAAIALIRQNADPFSVQVRDVYWDKSRICWQVRWLCDNGHRRRKSFSFRRVDGTTVLPSDALIEAMEFLRETNIKEPPVPVPSCQGCNKMLRVHE